MAKTSQKYSCLAKDVLMLLWNMFVFLPVINFLRMASSCMYHTTSILSVFPYCCTPCCSLLSPPNKFYLLFKTSKKPNFFSKAFPETLQKLFLYLIEEIYSHIGFQHLIIFFVSLILQICLSTYYVSEYIFNIRKLFFSN